VLSLAITHPKDYNHHGAHGNPREQGECCLGQPFKCWGFLWVRAMRGMGEELLGVDGKPIGMGAGGCGGEASGCGHER
jgi:hypothetical protein